MVAFERGHAAVNDREWMLSEAAAAIGAKWSGPDVEFSSPIRIDSREVSPGDIFWALPGIHTDGHHFLDEVLDRGARALVVDPVSAGESIKRILGQKVPALMVNDTTEALRSLSVKRLELLDPKTVIAITGTVGKTTTREMTRSVAEFHKNVHCARRSFNTWIGCALTVLESPPRTSILILEMGTNHPGEILEMARMFKPDYGIITEIGAGHLEGLGDERGVLEAKMELAAAGTLKHLSYNYDNETLRISVEKLSDSIVKTPVGRSSPVYRIAKSLFRFSPMGPSLFMLFQKPGGEISINSNLFGEQNAYAAAFAIAAGDYLGVPDSFQIDAIGSFEPLPGRGGVSLSGKGVFLIDETYNANPLSMKQALVNLGAIESDGKKFAVLGGMGELGINSDKLHLEVSDFFDGLDEVLLIGESWSRSLICRIPRNCRIFHEYSGISSALKGVVSPGDIVLFKGSRSFGMERVLLSLKEESL